MASRRSIPTEGERRCVTRRERGQRPNRQARSRRQRLRSGGAMPRRERYPSTKRCCSADTGLARQPERSVGSSVRALGAVEAEGECASDAAEGEANSREASPGGGVGVAPGETSPDVPSWMQTGGRVRHRPRRASQQASTVPVRPMPKRQWMNTLRPSAR